MLKYLVRDLLSALRFLPWGIVAGIVVVMILNMVNVRRSHTGRKSVPTPAAVCFYMYVVILLVITFFSRESGSGRGIDLELFSTWGINDRNNAYVVENVLLFIPYGVVCSWYLKKIRSFVACTALGLLSSLGIEWLQLLTQRGVFQIDDILTNMLGSMIGYLLFRIICRLCCKISAHGA